MGVKPSTLALAAVAALALACSSTRSSLRTGAFAALVGARTPAHDLEQVYYLGVFDPREQLRPTLYRVTVRGQASMLSSTKFASGWVPAELVDTLSSRLAFDEASGRAVVERGEEELDRLTAGRRLMLFGPEGFREAPEDFRLAIVMGSSPEAFFEAVDRTLGAAMDAQAAASPSELAATNEVLEALLAIQDQLVEVRALEAELAPEEQS